MIQKLLRAKTDKEQACAAGIGFGHAQLEERKELRVLTSEPGRLVIWAEELERKNRPTVCALGLKRGRPRDCLFLRDQGKSTRPDLA